MCQGKHLQILHEVNIKSSKEGTCLVSSATDILHLDKASDSTRVLLKVIRVLLRHRTLDRTMHLSLLEVVHRKVQYSS